MTYFLISSLQYFPIVIVEPINAAMSEVQHSDAPPSSTTNDGPMIRHHSPWPDFDKVVGELREWLTLLGGMLQTQAVTVGDLEEMEDMLAKQKVWV